MKINKIRSKSIYIMSKKARNANYTKEYNRKNLLRLLRKCPMSRAEISRQTGLSRACVSIITSELIDEGIIFESESMELIRGRTATLLEIKPDVYYAIGIYLNRDFCTAGIVDMTDNILLSEEIDVNEKNHGIENIFAATQRLISKSGIEKNRFCGVGISAPGPLDGERGIILDPTRFESWHKTNISELLSNLIGLPVYLENNSTSLATYHYNRNKSGGSNNFLLLLVDSGVGSGVIIKGKALKGAGYFTSELGHISINHKGRPCDCGNIGCLEEYAAIPHLLSETEFQNWNQIIDHSAHSHIAANIMQSEMEYLGTAIVSFTNIINIDTVLLAGDIMYGQDVFAPMLENYIKKHSFRSKDNNIRVIASSDSFETRLLSAADIVFERFLSI